MKVELYNQSIPFEGLASMISDKITEVYVEGVTLTGDEDSAFSLHKKLRGHPNLEKFAFVDVAAPEVEGEMDMIVSMLFVSAPKLSSLRFEKTKISWSSASAAAYCSSLKTLTLANVGFTDDDVIALATAVSKCPSLVSVDLRGNNISDAGCLAASSILQKSTSLVTVLLDGDGVAARNSALGPDPTKAAMERPTPRAA